MRTSFFHFTAPLLLTIAMVACVFGLFSAGIVGAQEPNVPPQPNPDTNPEFSDFGTTGTLPTRTSNVDTSGGFVPLVGLPGLTDTSAKRTLADYLNALFRLAIGLGALIAVIRIIYAGVKYMSRDSFFAKEEAKSDIQTSLLGLLIMLSVVLVLTVINPNLLNLNVPALRADVPNPPAPPVNPDEFPDSCDRGTCTNQQLRANDAKCTGARGKYLLQPTGRYVCTYTRPNDSSALDSYATDATPAEKATIEQLKLTPITDSAIYSRAKVIAGDREIAFTVDRPSIIDVDAAAELCEGKIGGSFETFTYGAGISGIRYVCAK